MRKVAITGGISSGKSTACRFLKEFGAYVVSTDEIVHYLLSSNVKIHEKICNLLGPDVLIDGQLDKQAIANKVFSQPETLKSLESILHPEVFHEIESQYQTVKNDPKYKLFIVEIPLLYETHSENLFDFVVVILSEEKLCKERFVRDKKHTQQSFLHRMLRQMSPQEKASKAHFLLLNNGHLEELRNEVIKLATKLCSL